jgi:hypothetical protein
MNDASLLARVPFTSASVTIYAGKLKKEYTYTIRKPAVTRPAASIEDEEVAFLEEDGTVVTRVGRRGLKWKPTSRDKEASSGWYHHRYLPTSRLLVGQSDAPHLATVGLQTMSEEQIDTFFAESIKRLWIDYSSELLGRVNTAQQDGLASILKAVLSPRVRTRRKSISGLDSHQAYERMEKFVARQASPTRLFNEVDFKKRFELDSTLRRVVYDIDRIEGEIELASAPRRQLEAMVTSLFSGGKAVSFTDQAIEVKTIAGIEIGTASLSSGEKHLLMVLVATLLAGSSSIIVDEPEISMHVDWQKALIKNMRTLCPEAQLIVATHSPEVMADIDDKFITRM